MQIKSEPITSEKFLKFGMVVKSPTDAPTAQAEEFKFWSDIAHFTINAETEIGLCTVFQQPETVISGMERHLQTPEILIPIDAPFVLPLLLEGAKQEHMQAFTVNIGEAVVINRAVWHGACIPVGKKESSYFVIFRRGAPDSDVEKKSIQPVQIEM